MTMRVNLFDVCYPGDLVTFRDRFGSVRRGKATIVNRQSQIVVCNVGGRYGRPECVPADRLVSVSPSSVRHHQLIVH